jgi:hypothetical protein
MNKAHGSPYDRGSADAYYQRPPRPHYYNRYMYDNRIESELMTAQEITEYNLGYNEQVASGDFKNWGDL